ncbi:MAG: ribosome biogenesis GTPase YlqF [Thermotogaceae bacterium]|nr:ribosome biogenesis GTPase YlqF [Thermotogaceae bacterium]
MWNPGHIAKAKRKIKELVKAVNYVLEVRDARAPFATGAYEREKLFKGKKTIIILNKADLAEDSILDEWIEYFVERGERVVISKKGDRSKMLIKKIFGERASANILVVGLPNVGKSTFINRLKGKKSVKVGAVPGITRGVQWVQINDRIKMLDTPGILYTELFSKKLAAKLILAGSIPSEKVDDWELFTLAFDILKEKYPGAIKELSGDVDSFDEFITVYGKRRGMLQKGGVVDIETAAIKFFQEISTGKYGKMSFETPRDIEEGYS